MKGSQQNNIDIVYVLGGGSAWLNNEIRFSLRSIVKNLKGWRNIYIVGERPIFLDYTKIKHVYFPDKLYNNADGNIINKVLRACQIRDLSEDFLFINDDHLICKPIHVRDILPYHKGNMAKHENNPNYWHNFWRKRLKRTYDILKEKGLPTYHYDLHIPIIFNREKFIEAMSNFNYELGIGFTMKSLYGNFWYRDINYPIKNLKNTIFTHKSKKDIYTLFANSVFISFNDFGLNEDLKVCLKNLFPKQTKFETMKLQNDAKEAVVAWLDNPNRSYHEGVKLYVAIGKNKHLKSVIQKKETEALQDKISREMAKLIGRDPDNAYGENLKPSDFLQTKTLNINPHEKSKKNKANKESSGRPLIIYNPNERPEIDFDNLPDELKDNYLRIKELFPQMAKYHEQAKILKDSDKNNTKRRKLIESALLIEDEIKELWSSIDEWFSNPKFSGFDDDNTTKLDAIEISKLINKHRAYISRNKKKIIDDSLSEEKRDYFKKEIAKRENELNELTKQQ